MQFVCGSHTTVSVNGVVGPLFLNGHGLRLGDPISPILFNFVRNAHSCILNRASTTGHISPVASHLIPSVVSHL